MITNIDGISLRNLPTIVVAVSHKASIIFKKDENIKRMILLVG